MSDTEHGVFLNPLRTIIPNFIQNTTILRRTIPTRRARRAPLPRRWIAKDRLVINVKVGLSVVLVKSVAHGTTIVTNQLFAFLANGESGLIAKAVDARFVLTNVIGEEFVKNAAVLGLVPTTAEREREKRV